MTDLEKIQDLQLEGIAKDIFKAELNFNIYLKIKNVWERLKDLDINEQKLFVYLKDSAVEKTVLHLSKLYDNPNKKYPTRCIEEVIKVVEQNKEWLKTHFLTEKQWGNFVKCNQKTIQILSKFGDISVKTFITNLKAYLIKQKTDDLELSKLKVWRDKVIAHNESTEIKPSLSDDEVQDFIAISKSLFDYLNCFIQTEVHVIMSIQKDTFFIDKLIERTFNEKFQEN
jgi:hypothetical protein